MKKKDKQTKTKWQRNKETKGQREKKTKREKETKRESRACQQLSMAVDLDADAYYLERVELEADVDEDFDIKSISVDEELLQEDLDEDLDRVVRTIREAAEDALLEGKKVKPINQSIN